MRASLIAAALACFEPIAHSAAASAVELRTQAFDSGLYGISRTTFSHDGRLVAFLGYSERNLSHVEVAVFDVRTRRLLKALPVPMGRSSIILRGGIAFSPDDSRLAAGATEIWFWDTATWRETGRAPGPFARGQYAAEDLLGLAYTPAGKSIVAAYGRVWGPGDVRVDTVADLVRLSDAVRLAYRSDRAPETYDRPEVDVLDASTGAPLERFPIALPGERGDRSLITSGLTVSEDGRAAYVAVLDYEGDPPPIDPRSRRPPRIIIERVDLERGQSTALFERRQEDKFTALAVNADQSLLATGEEDGDKETILGPDGVAVMHETTDPVRLWASADGGLQSELGPPGAAIRRLLFLPDGTGVVACQTDARFHNLMAFWNLRTHALTAVVHVETPHPTLVACAVSPDGRKAVLTAPTGEAFRNFSRDTAYLVDVASAIR